MHGSMLRHCAVAGLAVVMLAGPVHAKKPFIVGVQVGSSNPENQGFSSVGDSIDSLDPDALATRFPTAAFDFVDADLDFRGIDIGMTFGQGTGLLDFNVAQLGFQQTFGRSCDPVLPGDCRLARKQALREVRDFLETNPQFLKRMLTALARFSPIDPLAGNPDSLFSRSSRADFQQGFTHKVSQIWGCNTTAFNGTFGEGVMVAAAGAPASDVPDIFVDARTRAAQLEGENEFSIGLLTSSTTAESTGGDYATTGYVVPLSYTIKLDSDPRRKIRVDLPLGYTDTEGATSYSLGFGVAYTHPLSDVWTLTPALGVGATGSDDLGSAGGVSSLALTSAYTWRLRDYAVSMGNSIGKYDALPLKIGDVEAEADISNTVLTNGVLLTGPNSLIARNLVMEYSFTDTRVTGDDVYLDGYDEFGFAVGYLKTRMGVIDSYSKIGLSYLVGSGDDGDITSLRLNLSARF